MLHQQVKASTNQGFKKGISVRREPNKNKDGLLAKAARTDSAFRRQVLRKLSRARTRLLVCFWTLPVYIIAIWVLLNNGRNIETIMWIYMGLYAIFAVDMASRRCPQCGNQFFVKSILLNLVTKRCVHCQLPMHPEADTRANREP